jgi:hypothetical protein
VFLVDTLDLAISDHVAIEAEVYHDGPRSNGFESLTETKIIRPMPESSFEFSTSQLLTIDWPSI